MAQQTIEKYMLNPEEANVKLDSPGNPTSTGWKIVTPEAWKFRWCISDKIQQGGPELGQDYYDDPDWYWDMTKSLITDKILTEEEQKSNSGLAAASIEEYLERQPIVIRPYEMLLGVSGYDEHAIQFDVMTSAWGNLVNMEAQAGRSRAKTWIDGEKRFYLINSETGCRLLASGSACQIRPPRR